MTHIQDNRKRFGFLGGDYDRSSGFDNTGLFPGNLADGISQDRRMVQAY